MNFNNMLVFIQQQRQHFLIIILVTLGLTCLSDAFKNTNHVATNQTKEIPPSLNSTHPQSGGGASRSRRTRHICNSYPQHQHPPYGAGHRQRYSQAYRDKASKLLWEVFKRRNQGSPGIPILVPAGPPRQPKERSSKKRRRRLGRPKLISSPLSSLKFPQMQEKPFDRSQLLPDETMLRLLNLQNFNTDFLSLNQPMEARIYPNGKFNVPKHPRRRRRRPRGGQNGDTNDKTSQMRLNLRKYFRRGSVAARLTQRKRRWIRQFVADYTLCPVRYTWKRQKASIWPRWIKVGSCVTRRGSCSMPPGMTCQPDSSRNLTILRYICQLHWPKERCTWYRVTFGVLESCKCACQSNSERPILP